MSLASILVTGLVLIITWYLWKSTRKPQNFPPGPPRYPFLGSIPYLMARQKDKDGNVIKKNPILNLLDQFGDIVGFYIGPDPAVVCSDYRTVKNLLKMEETTGRPSFHPVNELRPGWEVLKGTESEGQPLGVVLTDGKFWREQRRFLLRNLRDFGFGKSSMQDSVLEEAQKLVNEGYKLIGQPATLARTTKMAILNVIFAILVGEKLEFDNPQANRTVKCLDKLLRDAPVKPLISYFLPSRSMLRWKILEPFTKRSVLLNTTQGIYNLIAPFLKEHIKSHDPENIKDLMDLMIKESNETEDPESSFYKERGIMFMVNDMIELFIAGTETTSSTLMWTFLYMLHHPQVKSKVQKELEDVFGDNDPSMDLKPRCHYINAVLHESLRLSGISPFALPHRAIEKVAIGDYVIPKDTMILPCLQRIMRDPSHFKDPDIFIPERFIDAQGTFRSDDRVIPFSVGKRQCLGQSLAEMEYFLFFTMFMKKLDMNPVPGEELPSYDIGEMKADNFTRVAPDFKMILSKR